MTTAALIASGIIVTLSIALIAWALLRRGPRSRREAWVALDALEADERTDAVDSAPDEPPEAGTTSDVDSDSVDGRDALVDLLDDDGHLMGDGELIAVIDRRGAVVAASASAEQILGWTPGAALAIVGPMRPVGRSDRFGSRSDPFERALDGPGREDVACVIDVASGPVIALVTTRPVDAGGEDMVLMLVEVASAG